MLNTDLHNPAIKEEHLMTKEGFIRNNHSICDGGDLPQELLSSISDCIQKDLISLKEDDEARERVGDGKKGGSDLEMDKERESNYQNEQDQIVWNTESLLQRKRWSSMKSSWKMLLKMPQNQSKSALP
eukprot:7348244-Ditylum_brightwellii.AAC.1